LTEKNEIKERWREYTCALYKKNSHIKEPFVLKEYSEEPQILESEIRGALHDISNKKSPGCNGIPIEIMKAAGEDGIHALIILCRKIWDTGEWPRDWKKCTYSLYPFPRKETPENVKITGQ